MRRALPSSRFGIGGRERRRDDAFRILEEVVDDLDLLGPRAETGDRIHGLLGRVLLLDDLGGIPTTQRIGLVVENECLRPIHPEDVEPPVHEHAVELEGERPLRADALECSDPRGKRRARVGMDEAR